MSPRTATAALVLDAVERYGVLLVHDGALDCVTSLVTGGPVAGSWWSHPRANEIYNALGEIGRQRPMHGRRVESGRCTCRARISRSSAVWASG